MAPIPGHIIDRIRESSNIVDVISRYVSLKKRGRNFTGLCPFHQEKTPSFSVNPEKQIFHCFGCGEGGNVFTFLMKHQRLSFVDSVKLLSEETGIEIPSSPEFKKRESERDRLFRCNRAAQQFFCNQLPNSPESLRTYLKGRGITDESMKNFLIGYAPEGWDNLRKAIEAGKGRIEDYKTLGLLLTSEKKNSIYDRFRNRLMFPIQDAAGKVVGFGGRALKDEPGSPKYINSPESPVYQKSRVLYGINRSKDAIREAESVLVVEGYMDVIQLHQAGIRNVVATSGTALTKEHAGVLRRYATNVTLCYDADAAGVKAAVRGGETMFLHDLSVSVLILPEGEDPDSYVKNHGPEAFREQLAVAQDYWEFRLSQLTQTHDMQQAGPRSAAVSEILDVIAGLKDQVKAGFYIERSATVLGIQEDILYGELKKKRSAAARKQSFRIEEPPPPIEENRIKKDAPLAFTGAWGGEKDIILLLINFFGDIRDYVYDHLTTADFLNAEFRKLFERLKQLENGTNVLHVVLETIESDNLRALFIREMEHTNSQFSKPSLYLQDCIKQLKIQRYRAEAERAKLRLKETSPDEPAYMEVLQQLHVANTQLTKWRDVESS